jgi:hypothetical protein
MPLLSSSPEKSIHRNFAGIATHSEDFQYLCILRFWIGEEVFAVLPGASPVSGRGAIYSHFSLKSRTQSKTGQVPVVIPLVVLKLHPESTSGSNSSR